MQICAHRIIERDRERQRDTERDIGRKTERRREIKTDRDRERERQREKDKEKQREKKRQRERQRHRETFSKGGAWWKSVRLSERSNTVTRDCGWVSPCPPTSCAHTQRDTTHQDVLRKPSQT